MDRQLRQRPASAVHHYEAAAVAAQVGITQQPHRLSSQALLAVHRTPTLQVEAVLLEHLAQFLRLVLLVRLEARPLEVAAEVAAAQRGQRQPQDSRVVQVALTVVVAVAVAAEPTPDSEESVGLVESAQFTSSATK